MDVSLPECPYLHPGPKVAARIRQWREALAIPEDAMTFLLEIFTFLATVVLILATGVILLMAG